MGLTLTTLVLIAGCGGGGGDSTLANATPSVASAQASGSVGALAAATASPGAAAQPSSPAQATDAAPALPTSMTLTDSASVAISALSLSPARAARDTGGGRIFYVDSQVGDDTNDGTLDTTASAGRGPWRTLARLKRATLWAGDTVQLACGSQWNETLRVPASGTASQPITVRAPASGCSVKPTIDGSFSIAPTAWTQHAGNIYKSVVAGAPLQVYASSGSFTEAHHPNAGYLASDPSSPYAAIAADGNVVVANGRTGSNVLTTGADLALPAGAAISIGTRIRMRTNSWLLDELTVTAVNGAKLTLSKPTAFPLTAGWGYFMVGQLWMLDSPGEWHYKAATGELFVWMPDSAQPTTPVTVGMLDTGIDLSGRAYVQIDGIAVRRVSTGVKLLGSNTVTLRNSSVEDTAEKGADAASSVAVVIESNTFTRIGTDAISARDNHDASPATGMKIRNNIIRDSGVLMDGEKLLSLPRSTYAAITSGQSAQVTGNVIINAGYHGIGLMGDTVVEDNFIYGACTTLDDCGGIYLSSYRASTIRRNTVVHARGNASGKPSNARYTQGQGVYLDWGATDNIVEDNTVIDADNGIQIHIAAKNTVRGNRLYGNRISQLWMQETSNQFNPAGDVYANLIDSNQIAPILPGSIGLLLQSSVRGTADFGTFTANRYFDRASSFAVVATTPTETRVLTTAQWRQSRGIGSRSPVDTTGSSVADKGYASFRVAGSNLVPNSSLATSGEGWTNWSATAPFGRLVREACSTGYCLRYRAGASPGLVSSPSFSVTQGQWYRLTLDMAASKDSTPVQVVVRRGGGGSNGYESLSDRSLTVMAGMAWGRYSVIFQATQNIVAGNPLTLDNGARVDFEQIAPGSSVDVANVELVPIALDPLARLSGIVVNSNAAAAANACPFAATQPSVCSKLMSLTDDLAVSWPMSLAGRASVIFYAQEPTLKDSDGDGIPDGQDLCPGTAPGAAVNANGCSYTQN